MINLFQYHQLKNQKSIIKNTKIRYNKIILYVFNDNILIELKRQKMI